MALVREFGELPRDNRRALSTFETIFCCGPCGRRALPSASTTVVYSESHTPASADDARNSGEIRQTNSQRWRTCASRETGTRHTRNKSVLRRDVVRPGSVVLIDTELRSLVGWAIIAIRT